MRARPATAADADLLLRWRNHPDTVHWSRTPDPVPRAEHVRWLAAVLADPDRVLLVVESADGTPVGTVRLDRLAVGCEVSITVAPEHRGRGLAGAVLAAGESTVDPSAPLLACVHRDNTASQALFRRAGYHHDHTDADHDWFTKPVAPPTQPP